MGLERLIAAALSPSAHHHRLAEYVARQAALGRRLADVLEDPFVLRMAACAHIHDVRALLEDPLVTAAVHRAQGVPLTGGAVGPSAVRAWRHPEWAASAWCAVASVQRFWWS